MVGSTEECPVAEDSALRDEDSALGDEEWFVSFALGQLQAVGGVRSIEMFGGQGLFFGRTFFGIMSAGRLYLKTDPATVGEYIRRRKQAFHSGETGMLRTYFELPVDVLRDRGRLAEWVRAAVRSAIPTGPAGEEGRGGIAAAAPCGAHSSADVLPVAG
jgi:DNA transformation protein